MTAYEQSQHTTWKCKYHIVFNSEVPQEGDIRCHPAEVGPVIRDLAHHRESRVEEGHTMPDHIRMILSIPPKYGCRLS